MPTKGVRSYLRGMWDKLRGKKKPAAPKLPQARGHRGRALRSLLHPDLSPENVAKWRELPEGYVEDFVYHQQPLFVHSSNVVMCQFWLDEQKMLVEYGVKGPKRSYLYSNVSEAEATGFAQADSKGAWCWTHLRVRGSKTAHRKPYVEVGVGWRPAPGKPLPEPLPVQHVDDDQVEVLDDDMVEVMGEEPYQVDYRSQLPEEIFAMLPRRLQEAEADWMDRLPERPYWLKNEIQRVVNEQHSMEH